MTDLTIEETKTLGEQPQSNLFVCFSFFVYLVLPLAKLERGGFAMADCAKKHSEPGSFNSGFTAVTEKTKFCKTLQVQKQNKKNANKSA